MGIKISVTITQEVHYECERCHFRDLFDRMGEGEDFCLLFQRKLERGFYHEKRSDNSLERLPECLEASRGHDPDFEEWTVKAAKEVYARARKEDTHG